MHEHKVAVVVLVPVVPLLVHEPTDSVAANTVRAWQTQLTRTLKVLRVEGVNRQDLLLSVLVQDRDSAREVTEVLLRILSVIVVGVPFVPTPRSLEVKLLIDAENLVP
jgi:hypothetical protein